MTAASKPSPRSSGVPLPGASALSESGTQPRTVTADFPIIAMGHGKVEVGDGTWEGLPVLWFGNDGQGLGYERERGAALPIMDRETLVMFTFANIGGLEAIEFAIARLRATMTAPAEPDSQSRVLPPEAAGQDETIKIDAAIRMVYGPVSELPPRDVMNLREFAHALGSIAIVPPHHTGTAGSTTPHQRSDGSAS